MEFLWLTFLRISSHLSKYMYIKNQIKLKENWELIFWLGCMIFKDRIPVFYELVSQLPVNSCFLCVKSET